MPALSTEGDDFLVLSSLTTLRRDAAYAQPVATDASLDRIFKTAKTATGKYCPSYITFSLYCF